MWSTYFNELILRFVDKIPENYINLVEKST